MGKFTEKQKQFIAIILGLLLLIILTGLFFIQRSKSNNLVKDNEPEIKLSIIQLEYGEELENNDFIIQQGDKEHTVTIEDIDTMTVATTYHETEIEGETKKVTVEVSDTQAPNIEGETAYEVEVDNDLDLGKEMTAKDPVDGELELTVDDKNLDLSTVGDYKVIVSATDKNGLKTKKTVTVVVIEKEVLVVVEKDEPVPSAPIEPDEPAPSTTAEPSRTAQSKPATTPEPSKPATTSEPSKPATTSEPSKPATTPSKPKEEDVVYNPSDSISKVTPTGTQYAGDLYVDEYANDRPTFSDGTRVIRISSARSNKNDNGGLVSVMIIILDASGNQFEFGQFMDESSPQWISTSQTPNVSSEVISNELQPLLMKYLSYYR